MTENEKLAVHLAIGAAVFIIGFQMGVKRGALMQQAAAAPPDPMAWFTTYTGNY